MLFKINPETLATEPASTTRKTILTMLVLSVVVGVSLFIAGFRVGKNALVSLSTEEKLIIVQEFNKFDESRLIEKLKELNVKFPYIALAQARLETGNFSSKVFRENNNLFGMREAKQRITTAKGTENNHAYYHSWHESVLDYAFYQCRYLSGIQTEAQYLDYLRQSYAEDPNYVNRLVTIITDSKLKEKF